MELAGSSDWGMLQRVTLNWYSSLYPHLPIRYFPSVPLWTRCILSDPRASARRWTEGSLSNHALWMEEQGQCVDLRRINNVLTRSHRQNFLSNSEGYHDFLRRGWTLGYAKDDELMCTLCQGTSRSSVRFRPAISPRLQGIQCVLPSLGSARCSASTARLDQIETPDDEDSCVDTATCRHGVQGGGGYEVLPGTVDSAHDHFLRS